MICFPAVKIFGFIKNTDTEPDFLYAQTQLNVISMIKKNALPDAHSFMQIIRYIPIKLYRGSSFRFRVKKPIENRILLASACINFMHSIGQVCL